MKAVFDEGPWLPGRGKNEHLVLADHWHDALIESIGTENYTQEVRDRFNVMVQGHTAMAINEAKRWIAHWLEMA